MIPFAYNVEGEYGCGRMFTDSWRVNPSMPEMMMGMYQQPVPDDGYRHNAPFEDQSYHEPYARRRDMRSPPRSRSKGGARSRPRRSRSRSSSRSKSKGSSRYSRRGDRYHSRWSRSRSGSKSSGSHDRSPTRDRRWQNTEGDDSKEPSSFTSALPYLSSLNAQGGRGRSERGSLSSHSPNIFGQPHFKIVMKMLPSDIQRESLIALISQQGFQVKDIRVIHKGPDRCFGFVEFSDVNSAQSWMEFNKGILMLDDGRNVPLEYSRYDNLDGRVANSTGSGDWMCAKCTIKNFKNRGACFKCNLTKHESDGLTRKGYAAIGVAKCDTLLLREIPLKCTESDIQTALSKVSSLELLRVHIAESGLYAYVQMRTADDAERLMLTFNQIPLLIDGCTVMVTYSRLPLNTVLSTTQATEAAQKAVERISQLPPFKPTAGPSGNSGAEAAQLAIAKAALLRQMTNSLMTGETDSVAGAQTADADASRVADNAFIDLGTIETPWGTFTKYPTPNPTLYQFEPSSGLYYDPSSGLYYDSNSQYYWDGNNQKWKYWSSSYQTYLPCETTTQPAADGIQDAAVENGLSVSCATEPTSVSDKKSEQPKSAKDIAREMAKWAKRQSKVLLAVKTAPKLETTSPLVATSKPKPPPTSEATADITFKMLEKSKNAFGSVSDDEDREESPPPKITVAGISRLPINTADSYHNRSEPVSSKFEGADESEINSHVVNSSLLDETFADTERLFCTLCKRKFGNVEILMKHIRLSDLHKKNLEAYLASSGFEQTPYQSTSLPFMTNSISSGQPQYRDRAKERRNMFGLDPSGFATEMIEAEAIDYSVRSQDIPIDGTNIGSKLLKSMGWSEGMGIGKSNQGIVAPIIAERRVEGAGLGAAGSRVLHGANASRRERARTSMMTRFNELS